MIDLSIRLAKNGQKVIVRPHPSENIEIWKKYTKNYSKKIKIIRSGNVLSWILAAKLLIHNGCTTAIEALFLKKKIISFCPYQDTKVESYLPNAMGIKIKNTDDILNYIKKIRKQKIFNFKILDNFIKKNAQNDNASIRILNLINGFKKLNEKKESYTIIQHIFLLFSIFKSFLGGVFNPSGIKYINLKCPKLNINQVNNNLKILSKNERFDFKRFNISYITDKSLQISLKNNEI